MTILIVDDHSVNRRLLHAVLETEQHEIIEASDGLEAIASLSNVEVDAIISDVLMPNMDGYRLCMEVRKSPKWNHLPFIIYTSTYNSPDDRDLAFKVGADRYIVKPAEASEILEAVSQTCREAGPTREVPPVGPGDEFSIIKQYNAALVAKLEEKNSELETAIRQLNEQADELRESEARFRQIADSIREVFWLEDPRTNRLLYLSPAFEEIWGRSRAHLQSSPWTWLETIHAEDRERVASALAKRSLGQYDEEYRIIRPDGKVRWIRSRVFPVMDASGAVCRIAGVAEDVTERKQIEAQLLRSQRIESIGTLASGIAHDLNNILAPVLMGVSLLRSSEDSAQREETLSLMENSARRGASIIRQLLAFGRGTEGARTHVQVAQLMKELVAMMGETFPRTISPEVRLPADLWPVLADSTQVHQLLLNLCVNARDAMPEGGRITLSAQNVALPRPNPDASELNATPGPYVEMSVIDTGTGIPPNILQRIFEPFFTTKGLGKGTGLGLSMALGIVKGHKGIISVHSELGKGTSFHILLPAVQEGQTSNTKDSGREQPGHGETVLMVDDEEAVINVVRLTLQRKGYKVLTAQNGANAIELFLRHRDAINLVLTDILMPVMDGLALARALRVLDPTLPIIVVSGFMEEEQLLDLAALGITEVLRKPIGSVELLIAMRRALAKASPNKFTADS